MWPVVTAKAVTRAGNLIRSVLILAMALGLAGCGGEPQVKPSIDAAFDARARNGRLHWLVNLERRSEQSVRETSDPGLVRKVERAVRASGARTLDVTVLALSEGEHAPVVTLESAEPASYMKHDLLGLIKEIESLRREGVWYIELLDEQGRFAWLGGRWWPSGGTTGARPDLERCSPWGGRLTTRTPPPPSCPAD